MPSPRRAMIRDHPRSRGEYGWQVAGRVITAGSSPLSRGIRGRVGLPMGRVGIIPALAGNTVVLHPHPHRIRDHPRSRGEYRVNAARSRGGHGSSPLSRGIHIGGPDRNPGAGIIPALAGNTPSWRSRTGGISDHPRSRGEYTSDRSPDQPVTGPSPLSRGIHPRPHPPSRPVRIIPALAGNTHSRPPPRMSGRDHPRSRGEYYPPDKPAKR